MQALQAIGAVSDLSGQVIDQDGKGLAASLYLYSTDGTLKLGPIATDQGGGFHFTADIEETDYIKAQAPGYTSPQPFASYYVYPDNTYYIQLRKQSLLLPMAAAAAMLVFLPSQKKKKVSGITTQDVIPFLYIAGALIIFNKGAQLFQWLGLSPKKSTQQLDISSQDPNSFWNPYFWQKAPGGAYSYAITESQARDILTKVNDSFGAFNDNESQATGALKELKTQANLSFVAWEFLQQTGQDFLEWLRGGSWPNDRLSDDEVYNIHLYFGNLPKF